MYDFLFINSPNNCSNPHIPYALIYLISHLEKKGFKCFLIDERGSDTPNAIEEHLVNIQQKLINYPSRFIGIPSFHSDYDMVMKLGKMVKECQPKTTLLVGNAHASIDPQDFIYYNSPFDIAVIGEGEITCEELGNLKDITYSNLMNIKGLAFMNCINSDLADHIEEIGMARTEKREVMDMTSIDLPAYHHLKLDSYLKPQKLILRRLYTRLMPIFASRSCPFNCHFCSCNLIWKQNIGKRFRIRTVDSVLNEIRYLHRQGMDQFYIFDDAFNIDKKWMKEWFEKKNKMDKQLGYQIPYACQTRVDLVTEDFIINLKKSGVIQLDLGVEAGSQKLLDKVNKQITKDQVREAFKLCRKYNIRSFATMLINLPEETEEDLKETYEFLEEIKPSAGLIFGVTTPYPGSEIYKYCNPPLKKEEYGLLINNRLNPIERFRMANHNIDLEKVWDKWNRHFKATPMFERMWAMNPFQPVYWKSILRSRHKTDYIKMWIKDLFKTFILYWSHKLKFYRLLKRIQYRGTKKY